MKSCKYEAVGYDNPNAAKGAVREVISEKTFDDLNEKFLDFKRKPREWRQDVSPVQLELEGYA